jgi:aminopeptidase
MTTVSQTQLDQYIDVILEVGLNLRAGQRLLIEGSLLTGVDVALVPFVRRLAEAAYRRGAAFVDVLWRDPQQDIIRLKESPRLSLEHYPRWPGAARLEHFEAGDAVLTIHADDPDLLAGFDPGLIAPHMAALREPVKPAFAHITRNAINWCVVAAPVPEWAAKVLPDAPAGEREGRLWQLIFETCRVAPGADAVAAWRQHVAELGARAAYLNRKQYGTLVYSGPGTHLTVGLPPGHIWQGGGARSETGIEFVPNLPTEEIFTLPHRTRVDGDVTSTKPFAYGGATIDGMSLTFAEGKVVRFSARTGEGILGKLLQTDEGSIRLGEVALVPNSSPVSRLGVTFHNALFDENAASHLALGDAYRFSLKGAAAMSPSEFAAVGGNHSDIHSDFMIGSGAIDIDGIHDGGKAEPVMRAGEWAFEV